MRALVIGRGSMGKRRIRDLTTLGVEVESWDITDEADPPDLETYDINVVSTPPMTKRTYPPYHANWVFTEADVEPLTYPHFPSATSRFTDWYAYLRDLPQTKTASAYTLHVGQHLADWHPGADLSTYYAARRETGACREMIPFELCWLTGLFGPVTKAVGMRAQTTTIAPIDDVYQVVVEHGRKEAPPVLGHLLIDAVSRPPQRAFTLVSEGYTRCWALGYEESHYLAEMRAFIAAVKGEQPWPYSQAEEAANLEVLRMIERT